MPRIVHLQIQIGAVSSQQSRGGRRRPPPLQALDHFIKMIRAWNVSFCRWFAALSWKSRCWYSAMIWNPFCNGMLTYGVTAHCVLNVAAANFGLYQSYRTPAVRYWLKTKAPSANAPLLSNFVRVGIVGKATGSTGVVSRPYWNPP